MNDKRLTAILLGFAALVAIALTGTCALVVMGVRGRTARVEGGTPSAARPEPPAATTPEPASSAKPAAAVATEAIPVANPTRADLVDIYPHARALALKTNPQSQFVGITAFALKGGVVDIPTRALGPQPVLFEFEYLGFDKTKPPGQDKVEGAVTVHVTADGFQVRTSTGRAVHLRPDGFFGRPLDAPTCRSAKMWAQAVKSGVPDNAVARITLQDNRRWTPEHPLIWRVWIDGHDEYTREIDAKTCKIVDKKGASKPPQNPQQGQKRKKSRSR
jgi:hypothetical protein